MPHECESAQVRGANPEDIAETLGNKSLVMWKPCAHIVPRELYGVVTLLEYALLTPRTGP